jgi:hypothetical protein
MSSGPTDRRSIKTPCSLDPQLTYRKAMEYCDVQGKVAVFRGTRLVHQQQMANYDCE